jgi:hypothetical protein
MRPAKEAPQQPPAAIVELSVNHGPSFGPQAVVVLAFGPKLLKLEHPLTHTQFCLYITIHHAWCFLVLDYFKSTFVFFIYLILVSRVLS